METLGKLVVSVAALALVVFATPLTAPAGPSVPPVLESPSVMPAHTAGEALVPVAPGDRTATIDGEITTRAELSASLFGGNLSKADEARVIKRLTALARTTIFSPKVYDNDPIAFSYTVKPGDTLERINRRLGLNLPTDVIEDINGDCDTLVPGRKLKLLRGPFHAQISKRSFSMYVYLKDSNGEKVFVRRVKVALGKNDATPLGVFRIAGKAEHVTWTPPPSMARKYKNPVKWGQKGYPLGKDGYFMSLRGTEAATRGVKGYGIHGTNAQWSIGKAASHGCIRVGDADIEPLWTMMTEGASTVQIVP